MAFCIFVSNRDGKRYFALTEGTKLIEYDVLSDAIDRIPGAVINGSVQEASSSLEACFVNIGPYKQAFLPRDGKELHSVKAGTQLPVQIKKAPVDLKGAQVSSEIELAGHYWILLGNETKYGVSAKINEPEERSRLKALAQELSSEQPYCFIARTLAEGVCEETLRKEAGSLSNTYRAILKSSKLLPVAAVLYLPPSPADEWFVRYLPEKIVFDCLEDKLAFCFVHPEAKEIASLYSDPNLGMEDVYKISSQLTKAAQKTLNLEGGGTVVIEETAALCAIDVNSGKNGVFHKEETVFAVNLKAAEMILDQIRLRCIGGMILIDFINMKDPVHQARLLDFMQQKSRADSAQIRIYGFTKLGLLEMTRERKGLSLSRKLKD